MVIASRASIIAADSVLVLITWFSLFRKDATFHLKFDTATLGEVLLRDGECIASQCYSLVISHILQGLSTSCLLFYSMSYLPLPLIPPKYSVIVVLNALHLAFSLVSVSDYLNLSPRRLTLKRCSLPCPRCRTPALSPLSLNRKSAVMDCSICAHYIILGSLRSLCSVS